MASLSFYGPSEPLVARGIRSVGADPPLAPPTETFLLAALMDYFVSQSSGCPPSGGCVPKVVGVSPQVVDVSPKWWVWESGIIVFLATNSNYKYTNVSDHMRHSAPPLILLSSSAPPLGSQ